MKKTCLSIVLVVMLIGLVVQLCAESTVVPTGKTVGIIPLKHIRAVGAMWGIHAISLKDCFADKVPAWKADSSASSAPRPVAPVFDPRAGGVPPRVDQIPVGIDSIEPRIEPDTLVVRGDKDAVDRLIAAVALLDVPRKQVQVKCEIIEVCPEAADEVDSAAQLLSTQDENKATETALIAALRSAVSQSKARVIGTPILSVANDTPAVIQVSGPLRGMRFGVVPYIYGNGTITVSLNPSVTDRVPSSVEGQEPEVRTQELLADRRLEDGKSTVLGGFFVWDSEGASKKLLYFIVTVKIVG